MDTGSYTAVFLALGSVLLLMGAAQWLARTFLPFAGKNPFKSTKRMDLIETMPLSPQQRAILLRIDAQEYLVVLGPNGQTVVKHDESPLPPDDHDLPPSDMPQPGRLSPLRAFADSGRDAAAD